MADFDTGKLREMAFDIMNSYDTFEKISTKLLGRECEKALKLPKNTLSGDDEKTIIASLITEYKSIHRAGNKPTKAEEDDGEFKKKKFSKAESEFIMKVVKEYISR